MSAYSVTTALVESYSTQNIKIHGILVHIIKEDEPVQ